MLLFLLSRPLVESRSRLLLSLSEIFFSFSSYLKRFITTIMTCSLMSLFRRRSSSERSVTILSKSNTSFNDVMIRCTKFLYLMSRLFSSNETSIHSSILVLIRLRFFDFARMLTTYVFMKLSLLVIDVV